MGLVIRESGIIETTELLKTSQNVNIKLINTHFSDYKYANLRFQTYLGDTNDEVFLGLIYDVQASTS